MRETWGAVLGIGLAVVAHALVFAVGMSIAVHCRGSGTCGVPWPASAFEQVSDLVGQYKGPRFLAVVDWAIAACLSVLPAIAIGYLLHRWRPGAGHGFLTAFGVGAVAVMALPVLIDRW